MDFDRTASYDDRIECCIWKFTWKNGTGQGICRRSVSGLCTDRTTVVFLFLFLDEQCDEVDPRKQCDDQKSVCSEIYVALVGDFIQLRDLFDLVGGTGRCYAVLFGNRLL